MVTVEILCLFAVVRSCAGLHTSALAGVELADEKTPYDYVKERLDKIGTHPFSGLPLSNSFEVEEGSEDDDIQGAATSINAVGLGTGIGLGGQGLGIGLGGGGVGGGGVGGVGGIGGLGGIGGGIGGIGGIGTGVGVGGIGGLQGGGLAYINPGIGGIGGFGLGGLGIGNGLLYPLGVQVGSGYVDKKAYDAAQKKAGDENVEKVEKKVEEEAKHGEQGFQQAAVIAKAEKGDSSFYNDEEAKKKAAGDEKYYEGGKKLDKHGVDEQSHKTAKSHKKGHVSKGFKTSSSKNEEEKTESFYDEAHDEADHRVAGQAGGAFGETAQSGFKGAHEEKVLDANAHGKKGHHVSEQKIDDSKGNKGEFAQHGYKGGAEQLEKFNNLGAHSVHGHQEASGGFQQNKGVLPIHH